MKVKGLRLCWEFMYECIYFGVELFLKLFINSKFFFKVEVVLYW